VDGRWLVVTVSREVSARVLAERAALRARRLYETLSATNEAIMRARTPEELFQRVCDVAVAVGGFPCASILLGDHAAQRLSIAARAGLARDGDPLSLPIDRSAPDGDNLASIAYRTEAPSVSRAFSADSRTRPWHAVGAQSGLKSAAALPITHAAKPIGVLLLCAADRRAFDEATLSLLARITENLAFALRNFDREAERERAEEHVRYLATHDALTGLPNRLLFSELLGNAIGQAERNGMQLAVMFIDLDRFKRVNDTLGHSAGDLLLEEMAVRLRAVLRASDVVARFGGDEFVVLVSELNESRAAEAVASKLLEAALPPVLIAGRACEITASIGIGLFPVHGRDQTTLLRNADAAMYQAKGKGKNTFAIYTPPG
jgi:diguanylate cyclase (GGDEF)-like protein